MMKKVLHYNFIPTKAEEEACMDNGIPWQVSRHVVEIRDDYKGMRGMITRLLTEEEVLMGRIVIPHVDAFQNVFRNWNVDRTDRASQGDRIELGIWDLTNMPRKYRVGVYLQKLANQAEDFGLSCTNLFMDLGLANQDEIVYAWSDDDLGAFLLYSCRKAQQNEN